jgi:FkbM family methyltransferase
VETVLTAAATGTPLPVNGSRTESYDFKGFNAQRFTFADVGVWNEDTSMRFYAPKDAQHVSHSIVNLQHTDQFFEAKCMTLRNACSMLKIDQIDILKLDVEGAEYTILKDLLAAGPRPAVLCTEFDEIRNPLDDGYMKRVLEMVDLLKKSGYRFRHAEHSNALFLR